jgi:hypothetical protein
MKSSRDPPKTGGLIRPAFLLQSSPEERGGCWCVGRQPRNLSQAAKPEVSRNAALPATLAGACGERVRGMSAGGHPEAHLRIELIFFCRSKERHTLSRVVSGRRHWSDGRDSA